MKNYFIIKLSQQVSCVRDYKKDVSLCFSDNLNLWFFSLDPSGVPQTCGSARGRV